MRRYEVVTDSGKHEVYAEYVKVEHGVLLFKKQIRDGSITTLKIFNSDSWISVELKE